MSPVELLRILRNTRTLVADSTHWTADNFAEDDTGKWVPVGSEHATRFNLAGALIRSASSAARDAMSALQRLLCSAPRALAQLPWANTRGIMRAQALDLLDWSISRLEAWVSQGRTLADLELPELRIGPGLKASHRGD